MIAKERPPALEWRASSLGHVLGHAGLSDINAELEEFSMDPRRSPQRIGNAHLADKLAYLRRYSWSAATAPRLPPPVRSEPDAVPFNHGLRLHDRQGAQHLRSQTIQAGEYQTVQHPERRPFRRLPPQHVKLMTGVTPEPRGVHPPAMALWFRLLVLRARLSNGSMLLPRSSAAGRGYGLRVVK